MTDIIIESYICYTKTQQKTIFNNKNIYWEINSVEWKQEHK